MAQGTLFLYCMDYEIANIQPLIDVLNVNHFIIYNNQELGIVTARGTGWVKWMDQEGGKWTCHDLTKLRTPGKNYVKKNIGMILRSYALYHNYIKEQ